MSRLFRPRLNKALALVVAFLVISATVFVQPAKAAGSLQRIAGPNRIGTAIETSRQLYPTPDSAQGVILARQDTFPDALAASSLAGIIGAPILLQPAGVPLDQVVHDEIDRLIAPGKPVFIIGGAVALSPDIDTALAGSYAVERLAGSNRFETAVKIKERGDVARGFEVAAALFARGDSYPDALSVSTYAAYSGTPILLVMSTSIPDGVVGEISSSMQSPYVIGGTSAISEAVLDQIESQTGSPAIRLSGNDRYATSAAIAEHFFPQPVAIMAATGQNFPDALAGGVLGGLTVLSPSGVPLLLVKKDEVPQVIRDYLTARASTIDDATSGYLMGGEATITLDTELSLEGIL